MKAYLDESELALYTDQPITMLDVENATLAIDAYKGRSFFLKLFTEKANLTKKRCNFGTISRGRLKHKPRADIVGVEGLFPSPFGTQKIQCGTDSIAFDGDESPYFTFAPPYNPVYSMQPPSAITVTYYAGYTDVPEELKRITAQLAANLRACGGGLKWSSREDFDLKITLTKDGIFTNEIKRAIDHVELS